MSSTAMWLLLAAVVIVILFASALYKRTFTPHELALTGVMAALSFAAYLFFRVPFYGGSSFHLGNTFTALAALLMDGVSGGLAGAIGLALADVLAGDPGYAVTTFVLKFIIGVVCGLTAHRLCRIDSADPARRLSYTVRVAVSAGSGLLVNVSTAWSRPPARCCCTSPSAPPSTGPGCCTRRPGRTATRPNRHNRFSPRIKITGALPRRQGSCFLRPEGFGMMQLLDTVNAALWGAPGVGLLAAAGVWLTVRTGFFQLTRLPLWLGQTLGAILRRSPDLAQEEAGSISPLESLCTALGATIGTGSVVGVGAALASGGPGAVFWMWVMALFGTCWACDTGAFGAAAGTAARCTILRPGWGQSPMAAPWGGLWRGLSPCSACWPPSASATSPR